MRMTDMDMYLADLGFKVSRTHETIDGKSEYRFSIEFDNHNIIRYFPYPEHVGPKEKDILQKAFLDELVKEFMQSFVNRYGRIPELIGYHVKKPIGYTTDPEMVSKYPNVFVFGGRQNGKTLLTKQWLNCMFGIPNFSIDNVIFNDPATIVLWTDGTKTVVKCQDGEMYDPEKGLAMAISKKALGNKHNYYHTFLKWLKKYEKQNNDIQYELKCSNTLSEASKNLQQAIYKCFHSPKDAFEYKGKRDAVQKAYDALAQFQQDSEVPNKRLNDVLRYLHDALED